MGWLKDKINSIKPIDLISGGIGVATRVLLPKQATAINAGRAIIAGTIATGAIGASAVGALAANGLKNAGSAAIDKEVKLVTSSNEVLEAGTPAPASGFIWVGLLFLGLILIIFKWK
jgi:hypothetical protein